MNKLEMILVRMKKAAAEIMVIAGMAILLIYILDAKKRIKIKRINARQLDKFLGKYLAEDARK